MRNWIIIAVVALVAYIAWRKFGGALKGAVSSVTA